VLEVRGLTTSFPAEGRRVRVVEDIDLELERGEVLALVGESGSGKSVTALSILRLVPKPGRVERGRVVLEGREIQDLPVPEMRGVRGSQIAMIFQEPMTSLNPVTRVGDQVVEAIRLHESLSAAEARRRTVELFDRVGIADPADRVDAYPHELSGGLKQRVMIAMALSTRPRVLIADEPTTALDVTIQAQILELLREVRERFGTAILLITHDLGVVNELADRVSVMYAGRIVEEGTREQVLGDPLHPYTRALLRSIPALARRGEPLAEIPGTVPTAGQWPTGCRFWPRCDRVMEVCRAREPARTRAPEGRAALCFAVERDLAGEAAS
jgi:peptide/nickel transport system ATP-binding protein/oligopeptide transport system ATP-binding protein